MAHVGSFAPHADPDIAHVLRGAFADGGIDVVEERAAADCRGFPVVTFTTPQLASAGSTEEQAEAAGHDCECRAADRRGAAPQRQADELLRLTAGIDARRKRWAGD